MKVFTVEPILEKKHESAQSIQHSTTYSTITIKILRTVVIFPDFIGLSFHRLATTSKLIITVFSDQFCSTVLNGNLGTQNPLFPLRF